MLVCVGSPGKPYTSQIIVYCVLGGSSQGELAVLALGN